MEKMGTHTKNLFQVLNSILSEILRKSYNKNNDADAFNEAINFFEFTISCIKTIPNNVPLPKEPIVSLLKLRNKLPKHLKLFNDSLKQLLSIKIVDPENSSSKKDAVETIYCGPEIFYIILKDDLFKIRGFFEEIKKDPSISEIDFLFFV
jgi:hypothetical protein